MLVWCTTMYTTYVYYYDGTYNEYNVYEQKKRVGVVILTSFFFFSSVIIPSGSTYYTCNGVLRTRSSYIICVTRTGSEKKEEEKETLAEQRRPSFKFLFDIFFFIFLIIHQVLYACSFRRYTNQNVRWRARFRVFFIIPTVTTHARERTITRIIIKNIRRPTLLHCLRLDAATAENVLLTYK